MNSYTLNRLSINKKFVFSFFLIFLFLFLQGCEPSSKQEKFQEVLLQGKTMGTTFTVKVFVPNSQVRSLNLFSDVQDLLANINQSMSTYIDDSEISRFNRLDANTIFPISNDFRTVMSESIRLGNSTKTLDVTMGPLIDLWGFGPDKMPTKVPSESDLTAIQTRMGIDKLSLSKAGLTKSVQELELSLSAIAKGFGVDKVAQLLEENGFTNYMVEIGGELRLSGKKPNGDLWAIAIEQPDPTLMQRAVHRTLKLGTISVATSGDYRIFYELDGTTYAHIISPETGKPIKQDLVSVTVLHPSSMTADALATALTVMGTEKAKVYAQDNDLAVYLISKTSDGLQTYSSPKFEPYL
ncbi:FAD:protein FMN transferase [Pseudoalteromonas denitrificans]|uniref:FAD:protein FMN transferase n=1 Tax=Pseudoalteromonas denitrificans DSM 6059 TaxID=1123010 RepID=A0A1I1INS9_9GAMM|nr:FAD:protein FMN transferase [Pseudoalteromonas denitrificans]SFC35928.1 thiamine biosynthesis lipoprotein [Pseudoalteromonas denitrificans DSM 6059]